MLLESWDWTLAGREKQEVPILAETSRRERGLGRRGVPWSAGPGDWWSTRVPGLDEEADRY